jgi:TatD DNase family protein
MLTDAHCHPFDLSQYFPAFKEERRCLGVAIAASAWNQEQFAFIDLMSRANNSAIDAESPSAPVIRCFAVHPQLARAMPDAAAASLETLRTLAETDALDAIGEAGWDLFDERYRATEKMQDEIFAVHLELAIAKNLPLVLHCRRAIHKVFEQTKQLKKAPSVVFHSYQGTLLEGESLIKRGVNAYFSFGTAILLNHKTAQAACARLPLERLLTETDSPYQPLRGAAFSSWKDLPAVLQKLSELRGLSYEEAERQIHSNFREAFAAPLHKTHLLH